jgi:eukaryotic-like serine/threonine-protein kinase
MSPQRWQKVEEIFHQALEIPSADRERWIDRTCAGDAELRAEVASLLASDQAAGGQFVGAQVKQAVEELGADESQSGIRAMSGRQIGPYRLIRELGRGGMGAVYLAHRDDQQYESQVAIKLVRPGLDTDFILRRFRRERQILARLQHPNIARLFDGGTTDDGTPYLVMEYIEGTWITKYADEQGLTIEERLRLFLPVCAAVEHAHRNFVVHRDLKPGNILIDTSGAPKLLDFGVSKVLHATADDPSETQGVGMMTPDYASPEQILGDPITIASDIYSLGAVLYQLLCGARPHRIDQCTPLALERAICLDETVAPSAAAVDRNLAKRLRGDLDNVVLRAMQKEPARRYPSVEQMAEDIRRHLDHRPVAARPDSLGYRARKFVRRNRVTVALASLMFASLVGGASVAIREARISRERFEQVRKLSTIFLFDVEQAARDLPGSLKVRQLIASTGLEYLNNLSRSSSNDWALKRELATAYIRIGEVQGGTSTSNLGDTAGALKSFQSAQKLLDEVLQHSASDRKAAVDRMMVSHRLNNVFRVTGEVPRAIAACEDGLRRAEALLAASPEDPDLLEYAGVFHLDLALSRQQAGDLPHAAEDVSAGIRFLTKLIVARPNDREAQDNIAIYHARLGAIQAALGKRTEALASYRSGAAALESLCRHFPNDTHTRHELMLAYAHVGDTLGNPAYDNVGDAPGALTEYTKMAEIARTLHEADPNDVRGISDYGIALLRMGIVTPMNQRADALEKAEQLLQSAATRSPKDRGNTSHKAWAELELGEALLATGNHTSAMRYFRLAIATAEAAQAVGPNDNSSQRSLVLAVQRVAEDQARSGDRAEALATLEKALLLGRRVEAKSPASSVPYRAIVARSWQAAGATYATIAEHERGEQRTADRAAARDWYARSVEEWRKMEQMEGFTDLRKREMKAALDEQAALAAQGVNSR